VSYISKMEAGRCSAVNKFRRRVAQAFEATGSKNKWGAPSFAFGAKGGNHEPLPDGFVAR
jgi:hypothetical protein